MASEFDEGTATGLLAHGPALAIRAVELTVVDGPDRGKRARVARGIARVGTSKGNTLCLTDPAVSRLHLEVAVRPDAVRLLDTSSTNGTFVGGMRVRDVDAGPGTLVCIGGTTIRLDFGEPTELELSQRSSFGEMVGASAEMRRIYAILEKAAASDATVLVTGETGTGKELVARAVHDGSPRAKGAFVAIDCGAIPETLFESELFGHTRGAFTGAVSDRLGVFEEADGGTLFFDEVGELPIALQPKLLRALETRQVRRVGSNQSRRVDVRVVAATNRSLARIINTGTFRDNLYYRLAVVEVELPPLRARRDDIPMLAAHLVHVLSGKPDAVPPELLSTLVARDWPGNVRELRNFIERCISLGWHDPHATAGRQTLPAPAGEGSTAIVPTHLQLREARLAWIEQFDSAYVRALLQRTGGHVTRAAALAGVSRRFFQRTMARVGVRSSDVGSSDTDDI